MPLRVAGGNLRIPGAAIALSHGSDAGGQETADSDSPLRSTFPGKARGVLSPHAEHFVSANDRGERSDSASDDRALLSGLVSNALGRCPSDCGVVLVDI